MRGAVAVVAVVAAAVADAGAAVSVAVVVAAAAVAVAAAGSGVVAVSADARRVLTTLKSAMLWPGSTKSTRPFHVLFVAPVIASLWNCLALERCRVSRTFRKC